MKLAMLVGTSFIALLLVGCGSEPPSTVGDNPAAANGKKADDLLTKEQKDKRARAMPKGSPW